MNRTQISAKIVADSLSPQGNRLTSVLVVMPRIIIAEMNTHRMLSKNTSSSRAIPFSKMVEAIQNDPFIPIAWQKHHSGMQGTEYLTGVESRVAESNWLQARDRAVMMARHMYDGGVTKQLCNRLLEPFMWTTMLITGSKEGQDNFFNLRCPQYQDDTKGFEHMYYKSISEWYRNTRELGSILPSFEEMLYKGLNQGQAEIHIMDLAEKIYDAMNESTPKQLKAGEYHIPFGDKITEKSVDSYLKGAMDIRKDSLWGNELIQKTRVKISTSMAARTSYTVIGDEKEIDYQKMIELYDRLISQDPPHSSPMEHCARAMSDEEYWGCYSKQNGANIIESGWCRNFKGFIQLRHLIETNPNF